jgi:alginate O-acetyltransferase complex protein AlgJ
MMETIVTPQAKSWLSYLPGVFIVLFLVLGCVLMLISPTLFKSPAKPLWNGAWSVAYEAALNKGVAFRQSAIATWGVLDYALFREGRDGVLVGNDGWLFTSEEFKAYPDGEKAMQEKLELASAAQKILAAQSSELLIVIVPSKARIYEENLGRYTLPTYTRELYQMFAEKLASRGITVVELTIPLMTAKLEHDVFLKTDTHWTPYGADVAAKEVARVISKSALLPSLTTTPFTTREKETVTSYKGDLLSYLPLGAFQQRLGPAFDSLFERTTSPTDNPMGGGLLGSSTIPVTLVGTSYSANPLWNFEGALKEALGADVLNIANQGEGPVVPMQEYLESDLLTDNPPELVVWEIPERFISVPHTTK